jgi:N4-gp56 family major capsid protein
MEGMEALRDWWSARLDFWGFNQLCGNTVQSDIKYTGNNAVVAPDTDHIVRPASGEAADESISTTSVFSITMLDKAVERAKTLTPAIRPVRVNGKPMYVVFIHPYQTTDLRTSTSTGQWLDITKSAMQGGQIDDNPIYSGHLGTYNGCVLHEDSRVTQGVAGAGTQVTAVRRAVFLGAQAGVIGYGRGYSGAERYDWVEKKFDYDNKRGVAAGLIGGLKKSRFNSTDYAAIVLATYAVVH